MMRGRMSIAVLYPRFDHPAIEERYAGWQALMRLRRIADLHDVYYYDHSERARDVAADVDAPYALVVTDPLALASPNVGVLLRTALESSGADIAIPASNESANPRQQRVPPFAYLTVRELEDVFAAVEREPESTERLVWDGSDPGMFLCRTQLLQAARLRLEAFAEGREAVVVPSVYVHTWPPLRAQSRADLLPHIPASITSLLEIGCGEGALGALVKERQRCRVVGIELDRAAAAVAARRLDDVYTGDVRHLLDIIDERFDCVVGSEIVEHVDDPWTLLAALRRVTRPGGHLVMSVPNIANASVILDLLRGRFDYAYIGLTCAGHLRFFTRKSIGELLDIAGWTLESIEPQRAAVTPSGEALVSALATSVLEVSPEDLLDTGYYVVARNDF